MNAITKGLGALATSATEDVAALAQEGISKAAYDKALTLGEQIANYTCKELKDQIPPMITSTTNEIIKQLTAKIDSERFTDDFINVLQTKLLDANSPYSDPFLEKFDDLFDRIIKDAENRRDKKKEEQQGYNSMPQDKETIDRLEAKNTKLKAEIADLKKSLSMYEPDIEGEVKEPGNQGGDYENSLTNLKGSTSTGWGRRKHSKKKKNQKKPTKQTKRVRFSMKK